MNIIVDNTIDEYIDKQLVAENEKRNKNHKSSGKLSASMLSDPVQWQILKFLAEKAPFDPYTLRKFQRGIDVENWLVKRVPGVVDTQKFLEYRNTIGYADLIVDTSEYENPVGIIPHEVKSVTNKKYSWIAKRGTPDDGHVLQASLYAMALDSSHLAIDYMAADDLRLTSFLIELDDLLKSRINNIIDEFQKQWEKKEVPVFEPLYKWQSNKIYNQYPSWSELNRDEIKEKMERMNIKFPE